MTTTVMPDTEGALRTYLRADTGLTALVAGRVFFGYPDGATAPLVVLFRVGGGEQAGEAPLDDGLVQFDCWGPGKSKAQAWAVTQAVIAALRAMTGSAALDGSTHGYGASGITWRWLPDPASNQARYVVTATVTARAA